MKKLNFFIILAFIISMFSIVSYAQTGDYETIKIGLFFGNNAKTNVTLNSDTGFVIGYIENDEFIEIESTDQVELYVLINDNGFMEVNGIYEDVDFLPIAIYSNNEIISVNGNAYRGNVILTQKDDKITVVNEVDLEKYLYSVIGKEMSPSWHIEALKAQAICARTYAINNWNKYKSYGFNLCTTQASQVYYGISTESPKTIQAVDETAGQIVKYNGNIAQTFYYSSNGGKSANVKYVWGSDFPYLTSVDDPFENPKEASYANWCVTITADKIHEKLKNNNIDIGNITDVYIDGEDNGTVYRLVIEGDNGEYVLKNESTRTFLGLNSQYYTVRANGKNNSLKDDWLSIKSAMPSFFMAKNMSLIEVMQQKNMIEKDLSFTFDGKGWGHRIGMSQWGAKAMAEAGFTASDIITFYFTGTVVE